MKLKNIGRNRILENVKNEGLEIMLQGNWKFWKTNDVIIHRHLKYYIDILHRMRYFWGHKEKLREIGEIVVLIIIIK